MLVTEESLRVLPGVFGNPVTKLLVFTGECFDLGEVKSLIVVIEDFVEGNLEELLLDEVVALVFESKCFLMSGKGLVIVSGLLFVEFSDLVTFVGFSGSLI